MAASLLRQVFQKRQALRISRILSGCCNSFLNGRKLMSTSAPTLILPPPAFGGGYKFYTLREKSLVTGGGDGGGEFELVGSSHGWLALFNPRNNDLLLSNPLSGRRIQLPRIEILASNDNLRVIVLKVILSSAPDEHGCQAMMAYSHTGGSRVAFCSPGRSWRWTRISDMSDTHLTYTFEDLVYCSSRRVLSCITAVEFDSEICTRYKALLVNWDIGNPLMDDWNMGKPEIAYWEIACPPMSQWGVQEAFSFRKARSQEKGKTQSWIENLMEEAFSFRKARRQEKGKTQSWIENLMERHCHCSQIPHLVYAEEFDQLYLATRFVSSGGQTLGFVLVKVTRNGNYEVVDDLNGLVMFVGINDSIAVPASRFPELRSNSIYFTHVKRIKETKEMNTRFADNQMLYTNDTGVFDYESKTIIPIIIGDDVHQSSPIWFYPPPDIEPEPGNQT